MVDLNASNLLVDSASAAQPWEAIIERSLKYQYYKLCSKAMVGLLLLVYVRVQLKAVVNDVDIQQLGVGVMVCEGERDLSASLCCWLA